MIKVLLTGVLFFVLSASSTQLRAQDTDADTHADFNIAYELMLRKEGGYVNSKKLKGGETYRGINRRSHPKWEGWRTIDKHHMKYDQVLPELDSSVKAFYREHYWDAINGDSIKDQKTANAFFYLGVNKGTMQAIHIKERAFGMPLTGEISDELIRKINRPPHHITSKGHHVSAKHHAKSPNHHKSASHKRKPAKKKKGHH